jgi:hypothetical protein
MRPGILRRVAGQAGAMAMVAILLLALPTITTAGALAEPITAGDWMRILFDAPDRKMDPSQKGVAVAAPPIPPPQIQTSSEPAPPKEPVSQTQTPRLWFRGDRSRTGRRRRRRR